MNRSINSKKIIAIVAVIALVAILGVCLAACNSNSVGKKLDKKDYNVVTLNDDATGLGRTIYGIVKNNSEFEEGLFATKGTDFVAVIWYKSADAAADSEDAFKYVPGAKVERSGKIVYVGSDQGIKDAK